MQEHHFDRLRKCELQRAIKGERAYCRILELGAGTGIQAKQLQERGFAVEAIDIPQSNYRNERVFPIIEYDGHTIPFADGWFDIVFSSNVLEHVRDLDRINAEILRVMAPGAVCIHVLPTSAWRIWTTLSAFPLALKRLVMARSGSGFYRALRTIGYALWQKRHGERGNLWSEIWYFRPEWWKRIFRDAGFDVVSDKPLGLFYTGHSVMGVALDLQQRDWLARRFGSATHLFRLTRAGDPASRRTK